VSAKAGTQSAGNHPLFINAFPVSHRQHLGPVRVPHAFTEAEPLTKADKFACVRLTPLMSAKLFLF
jgi:hypothetical protein